VPGACKILYADYILLIVQSVCGLDDVVRTSELKLDKLDMIINARKSSCLRTGAKNNALCVPLSLTTNAIIP